MKILFKYRCPGYACDIYDPEKGCLYWMFVFRCPYWKRKNKEE